MLQTLVEKHFPAPDRDRINRLLGLGANRPPPPAHAAPPAPPHNGTNGRDDDANTSKRKCESLCHVHCYFLYILVKLLWYLQ